MEHFEKGWKSRKMGWYYKIRTDEYIEESCDIAFVFKYFPGDEDGELTAQRICDYHNLLVPALRAVWADSNELGTGWQRPSTHRLLKKAIEAIGAEPTTAEPQKHASDERRGG